MESNEEQNRDTFSLSELGISIWSTICNKKLSLFYWAIANIILSLFFSLWYKLFFDSHSVLFSEVLNSAYIIFINAFLFSFLPNLDPKEKKNYNMYCFLKTLTGLSFLLIVIVPFVMPQLTQDCLSYIWTLGLSLALLFLAILHFIYQEFCKFDYDFSKNRTSAYKDWGTDPLSNTSGGRQA